MSLLAFLGAAILLHAYLGYPVSLWCLRIVTGDRSRHRIAGDLPPLTLVISAYNEERVLREKLENSLALDYPAGHLRVVVVSDGSTDGTEAIARDFAPRGVDLVAFGTRRGKVASLNDVIPRVTTDLVVMSDANSLYEPESLRRLVRHFADPRVGCVCGELRYVNPHQLAAGEGERLYWGYERWIKRLESSLGALLGANGAIYSYRTALFRPVDPLTFCDDVIPIRIAIGGLLTLYDPEARCTEEASGEDVQMRRRRRHASFGLRSMLRMAREGLERRRWLILYQVVSHRILRWTGGIALGLILLGSPFLPPPWRGACLLAQGVFYGAALAGFLISRVRLRVLPLYLPHYFLVITFAGLMGLAACLLRTDRPVWEPRQ